MEQRKDITSLEDIKILVDSFYGKVREDDLLAQIFNDIIMDRWPSHLAKMYRFWETVLLEEHTYSGTPFLAHATLPVSSEHFERWLQLFYQAVDDQFEGDKATRAKWQGQRMAEMFHSKIEYYKKRTAIPIR